MSLPSMEHLLFAINKRNNRQPKSFEDILNRHLKTCLSISNVQDRFPYIL
jgi:hypothetical protein